MSYQYPTLCKIASNFDSVIERLFRKLTAFPCSQLGFGENEPYGRSREIVGKGGRKRSRGRGRDGKYGFEEEVKERMLKQVEEQRKFPRRLQNIDMKMRPPLWSD